MDKIKLFIDSYELWREPVTAFLISGAILAYLGVWAVLKKAVFIPLAVAQSSSLGVVASFLTLDIIGYSVHPSAAALIFAVAVSLYFAVGKKDAVSASAAIYITASAGVLILGSFIRADMHDVESILFGNAVLVMQEEVVFIGLSALLVAILHLFRYNAFLFTGFDELGAAVSGFSPRKNTALLYFSFALMISVCAKSLGAMPVFALMTLPALSGFALGKNMKKAIIISVACGIFSGAGGFVFSFMFDLPTGATVSAVAGAIFVFTRFKGRENL